MDPLTMAALREANGLDVQGVCTCGLGESSQFHWVACGLFVAPPMCGRGDDHKTVRWRRIDRCDSGRASIAIGEVCTVGDVAGYARTFGHETRCTLP